MIASIVPGNDLTPARQEKRRRRLTGLSRCHTYDCIIRRTPFLFTACQRGGQKGGALFGKMIPRPLLGVVVFTCGFAADAENQVTNEETFLLYTMNYCIAREFRLV